MTSSTVQLNGTAATADQLASAAFAGYAHFTAMQVRSGAVRGLDLHLARLRKASDELFGAHLPDAQMRGYLRQAIQAAPADASSLGCFVTQRAGEFTAPTAPTELDVLVRTSAAAEPPVGPLSLDVVGHERHLAHLKHVGEVGKTFYLRHAVARGFDDAAFVDTHGRLSEATIWNLAFWDGESVIWPRADLLSGVTMQILARRLTARGVPQRTADVRPEDLHPYSAAVVMNSWTPGIAVHRIGDHQFPGGSQLTQVLHDAYLDEAPATV